MKINVCSLWIASVSCGMCECEGGMADEKLVRIKRNITTLLVSAKIYYRKSDNTWSHVIRSRYTTLRRIKTVVGFQNFLLG